MALDTTAPRSRRSLLTAAAGGAAALVASAAAPLGVAAAATNMQTETANASAAETSLNDSADRTVGFKTTNVGVAPAIVVHNAAADVHERRRHRPDGSGRDLDVCRGLRDIRGCHERCSVLGSDLHRRLRLRPQLVGDRPGLRAGRWGDSPDVGVLGSGDVGVRGEGFLGMVAAGGFGSGATGLRAWGGDGPAMTSPSTFGARSSSPVPAGPLDRRPPCSSVKVNLKGTTSSSRVFAVLHSNRASRYVRAVVPTTGSFTIYLNASVTSATYVAWFVIN